MDTPRRLLVITSFVLIAAAFTACGVRDDESSASILLFNGTGTSPGDVAAIETILSRNHLNYSTVNPSELNKMGESQIRVHRLLIVPGGNFVDIGNNLTSRTTANIRNAVKDGLNYLGICAGAFFAGNSP